VFEIGAALRDDIPRPSHPDNERHFAKPPSRWAAAYTLESVDPERARQLLARERERIVETLEGLEPTEGDEPTTTYQHLADQASDVYEAELDEGLSDDLRNQLAALERAEARLSAGTFGLSVDSGEPIPDERLEAIPTAERTAEEQARFEGRG
jgi:DnaK suppressor protein